MLLDWLEIVVGDVSADVSSEVRSFLAGVAEVESRQHASTVDVLDRVVETGVIAPGRRPRHPAIEVEGDPIGAKELFQRRGHSTAVKGVRSWVLWVIRRRAQWCPRGVRLSIRITVLICPLNGSVGAPGQIMVLGFEARDHRVAPGHMHHRQHARGLHEIEPAVVDDAQQAVIPLPDVVIGPEERLHRLCGRASRAVESAEFLNLVEILSVLLAGQRIRTVGTELGCALERERRDSRQDEDPRLEAEDCRG